MKNCSKCSHPFETNKEDRTTCLFCTPLHEVYPRITRDEMLASMADIVAMRSTCNRLHVGAVIAIEGRVLSVGYNGAPPGLPHCTPETCNANIPCSRTIHAEANSIAFASRYGVSIGGASLFSTHSPCIDCAKLIISAGISRVVFRTAYRDRTPLDLLKTAGIELDQVYTV